LLACRKNAIPVRLVNARMSPRSARRYRKFAAWIRPIYATLDAVAIQEPENAQIWQDLGVAPQRIHDTGSLKFDAASGARPTPRPEFQQMLDAFGQDRPVILAASTFPGEEILMAEAIKNANPDALAVIVPRHAERRSEVKEDLERAGFEVILRSSPRLATINHRHQVFVIDTTGELRDWTAHVDVVIIGKSFLSTGGQNPCEAILADKPIIMGPHMENFQPLANRLVATGGGLLASNSEELIQAILSALDSKKAKSMTYNASSLLTHHNGATKRIVNILIRKMSAI
jgi:3-deoxy-D-manno-octulosonic-acid transferase